MTTFKIQKPDGEVIDTLDFSVSPHVGDIIELHKLDVLGKKIEKYRITNVSHVFERYDTSKFRSIPVQSPQTGTLTVSPHVSLPPYIS